MINHDSCFVCHIQTESLFFVQFEPDTKPFHMCGKCWQESLLVPTHELKDKYLKNAKLEEL